MIHRAARFIRNDLSRTGRDLIAIREFIPPDLQVVGRDLLILLMTIVALIEMGIFGSTVMGLVLGLIGIFSRAGLVAAGVCAALLGPMIWVLSQTTRLIERLNGWSPSRPGIAAWGPASPLWDRELDGATGAELGI